MQEGWGVDYKSNQKSTRDLVISILSKDFPLSSKKIYYLLKKKHAISISYHAVYKVLQQLTESKILTKNKEEYFINIEWLRSIGKFSDQTKETYMQRFKPEKVSIPDTKQECEICKNLAEGFCIICGKTVCTSCGEKIRIHNKNCSFDKEHFCIYCNKGKSPGYCSKCFKTACNNCSKEVWVHFKEFCNRKETKAVIGILEVDHSCWFADLSEKIEVSPILNTFIDKKDKTYSTHSGKLVINLGREHKDFIVNKILKHKQIVSVKPVFISDKKIILRTRALFDKSVEQITKENNSILLNPVIASDSKERNIIIAPDAIEMQKLVSMLNQYGKCKLVTTEEVDLNNISVSGKVTSLLKIVDEDELDNAIHQFTIMQKLNEVLDET